MKNINVHFAIPTYMNHSTLYTKINALLSTELKNKIIIKNITELEYGYIRKVQNDIMHSKTQLKKNNAL